MADSGCEEVHDLRPLVQGLGSVKEDPGTLVDYDKGYPSLLVYKMRRLSGRSVNSCTEVINGFNLVSLGLQAFPKTLVDP